MSILKELHEQFKNTTDLSSHNTFQQGSWLVKCPEENEVNYFVSSMVRMIKNAKPLDNQIFIDLCDLSGWANAFFKYNVTVEGENLTILSALQNLIKNNPGVPVTVRYLDGINGKRPNVTAIPTDNSLPDFLSAIAGTSKDVKVYYGFLGTTLGDVFPDLTEESLRKQLNESLGGNVVPGASPDEASGGGGLLGTIMAGMKSIWDIINQIIKIIVDHKNEIISWNHSKILAINGTTVLQGGGNFWETDYLNHGGPTDLLSKVDGDSAIAAHKWCDKLWGKVGKLTRTWPENIGSAPKFTLTPPVAPGTDSVLSVGDPAFLDDPNVTLRCMLIDLFLNCAYYLLKEKGGLPLFPLLFNFVVGKFGEHFSEARQVRYRVLQQATNSVSIHQQKLVMDDLYQADDDPVKRIKEYLPAFDGNIWDFALMQNLAKLTKEKGVNIKILTSYEIFDDKHNGYQDPITAATFLEVLSLFDCNKEKVDYQRVTTGWVEQQKHFANHAKAFLVDDAILNIGSHNFYLGYNQEFEIYTTSATAINDWKAYFTNLFPKKTN